MISIAGKGTGKRVSAALGLHLAAVMTTTTFLMSLFSNWHLLPSQTNSGNQNFTPGVIGYLGNSMQGRWDIVNAALNLAYHLQVVNGSQVPGNTDTLDYFADYNPQQNPSSPSADFDFGKMTTILQGITITVDGKQIPAIPNNIQCTIFVNAVLQYLGQMGAGFPNAVDWGNSSVPSSLPHVNGQQWQTLPPSTLPMPGDVATWADRGAGHIGIVVGVEQPSGPGATSTVFLAHGNVGTEIVHDFSTMAPWSSTFLAPNIPLSAYTITENSATDYTLTTPWDTSQVVNAYVRNMADKATDPPAEDALPNAPSGDFRVVGPSSLTAARILQILQAKGSPAVTQEPDPNIGQEIYDLSVQYQIDAAFVLAFFNEESSMGTDRNWINTKDPGNIECGNGHDSPVTYTCPGRFRQYSTWADGFHDWFNLIRSLYVDQWGTTTVHDILYKYAPPTDGNDTDGYIRNVDTWITTMRNGQNI